MVILNLNALKTNTDNNSFDLKVKHEEKKVEIEEQTISKKKFSIKELNISGIEKENNTNENKNKHTIKTEEIPNSDISIKTNELQKETTNKSEIKKDYSEEVEVLLVSNGNTGCNITEEKSEIFGNYKGSYEQINQEEEKKPEKEIIQEVEIQEPKKTNLESYSNGNIEYKKNKSKKIILTSIFTITSLSLSGFFIIESGLLLKSNIQETKKEEVNIEVKKEEIKNNEITENNNTIENTKKSSIVVIDEKVKNVNSNNLYKKTGIVKKNLENKVDNNTNYSKIDERIKKIILKKYKK